jgi:hypothetical protein
MVAAFCGLVGNGQRDGGRGLCCVCVCVEAFVNLSLDDRSAEGEEWATTTPVRVWFHVGRE